MKFWKVPELPDNMSAKDLGKDTEIATVVQREPLEYTGQVGDDNDAGEIFHKTASGENYRSVSWYSLPTGLH